MNYKSTTLKDKILLFIYCNEKIGLSNFQEYCLDKEIVLKIIEVKKPINTLNTYFSLFTEYDYILYLDCNYIFNKNFYIKDYIKY